MTEYTVKPRGVVSQFKHGGFVVYEKNGHGLVAAITDLGKMDWNTAKTACDELILNGYSDWYLPSKVELNALYVNLKKLGVGGFAKGYWSSSVYFDFVGGLDRFSAWCQFFNDDDGYQRDGRKRDSYYVRAVRAF